MSRGPHWFSIAVVLAAACGSALLDPQPIDPPLLNPEVLCSKQDSLMRAAGTFPTIDAEFSVLAHLLPGGFGGLHTGGMYLVYPERTLDARQVASTLQQCAGLRVSFLAAVHQAPVLKGQFDWLQLSTWRSRIETDGSFRLVFTDIDEVTNRLGVGVPPKPTASSFSRDYPRYEFRERRSR